MMRAMPKKTTKDPYAAREARKYDEPIASREFLLGCLEAATGPLSFEQLAEVLKYRDETSQIALQRRLNAMIRDGQIFRNRKGEYGVVVQADLIPGRIVAHADGFGFLVPDAGGDDLFLAPKQMLTVLHGDRALVHESGQDRRGRREGKLVEVLERGLTEISGQFHCEGKLGFVTPQNQRLYQDILIPPGEEGKAKAGDFVVASIVEYPTKRAQAIGRVKEILGSELKPAIHIELAIRNFGLPHAWSPEVEQEISGLGTEVPKKQLAGRFDVRHLPLVTIDGEDARDFDDAVYCEPIESGWRLLVAIADVSAYVKTGTALDAEAYDRSTSTYFPDRVVPMLPEVLSNGLCSINPKVDRLCMLCEMEITRKGKLGRTQFHEAVMRSHARLTYTEVAAMLDGDRALAKTYHDILPHLKNLQGLYQALAKARRRRGAIDFESTETRFEFDVEGAVKAIVPVVRNIAHKMIEECMITANIAAARFLEKHKMPALYRVHAGPADVKLEALRLFLSDLNLSLDGDEDPSPKDFAKLLKEARQRPDAEVIQTVMLRSLKQAVYQPGNEGHFGLALDKYAHFTSPIRRYPDLLVHRAIRHVLTGGKARQYEYSQVDMERHGHHCSNNERRADEASWDVIEALKCEYLKDHVETEFDGVVGGVNSFGLFVELTGLGISGLVHVTALGHDYFHHDAVHHRLVGDNTGITFRIGEIMRVRLIRVDVDERKIDLEPVNLPKKLLSAPTRKPKPGKGGGGHRRGRRRR
jgi:ribonuclease R